MIYLDASVLVPLVIIEETTRRAVDLCDRYSGRLAVSDFALGEATAALARLVRTGVLAEAGFLPRVHELDAFANDLATIVPTTAADIRLATTFVRQHWLGLRLPDAIHLALCRRNGFPLVTNDLKLISAAQRLMIETPTF